MNDFLFWLLTLKPFHLMVLSASLFLVLFPCAMVLYSIAIGARRAFKRLADSRARRAYWKARTLRDKEFFNSLNSMRATIENIFAQNTRRF